MVLDIPLQLPTVLILLPHCIKVVSLLTCLSQMDESFQETENKFCSSLHYPPSLAYGKGSIKVLINLGDKQMNELHQQKPPCSWSLSGSALHACLIHRNCWSMHLPLLEEDISRDAISTETLREMKLVEN